MVGKLVRKELSVPCGADLREQVYIKAARRENPQVVPPVIVNGVDVVEFCHGRFGSCSGVVFGTAEVRISVKEYRCVVVSVKRIFDGIGVPMQVAGQLSSSSEACAQEWRLYTSVQVKSKLMQLEVSVLDSNGAVFFDIETLGECSRTVEVAVGVLVVEE